MQSVMSNSVFFESALQIICTIVLVNNALFPVGCYDDNYVQGHVTIGQKANWKQEYRLGVLAPAKTDYSVSPMSLNSTLVALQMSIEKLLGDLLPNFYFKVSYIDTDCNYKTHSMAAIISYADNHVHGFFGPMCPTMMPWADSLTRHYRLNSMTVGCHVASNSDPTAVRLMAPYAYTGKYNKDPVSPSAVLENGPGIFYAVKQMFDYFGWEMHPANIYSDYDSTNKRDDLNLAPIWSFVRDWKLFVNSGVEDYHVGLSYVVDNDMREKLGPLNEKQLAFSTFTRVLVVSLQPQFLRQFLYNIFYLKKFNIEEYVIVYLDHNYMIGDNVQNQPWRDPYTDESHPINQILKRIFRHVLIVRHEDLFAGNVTRYESIRDDFAAACKSSQFSNCVLPEKPEYMQYVAATYDGVKLLMESLAKSIQNGLKPPFHDHLNPYVRQKTFNDPKFASSPNVVFNPDGQRVVRINVLRMADVTSGTFSVHITYNIDGSNFTTGPGVPWITGVAPQNPPECGYKNEFCSKPNYLKYLVIIASIGVLVLVIIMLVVGFFVYKRVKFDNELMQMSWLINSAELDHPKTEQSVET